MSPTSYQTAPPRRKIITQRGVKRVWSGRALRSLHSAAQFLALAGIYNFLGIDSIPVNLLFKNFSVFTD